MDKIGFKPLMSFIAIVEVIVAGTFYFSVHYGVIYVVSVVLIAACIGGHFSTLPPFFKKIYGLELGSQMYSLCGFFIGFANFTGPLLSKFFLDKNSDYLVTFLIGGALVFIKIVCLFLFDESERYQINESDIANENIGAVEDSEGKPGETERPDIEKNILKDDQETEES